MHEHFSGIMGHGLNQILKETSKPKKIKNQ